VWLVVCAESKSEVTLSAHQIFSEFFSAQVLTELCRQLVLNYFPLHEDELRSWQTDPENFSEFWCVIKMLCRSSNIQLKCS